MLHARQNATEVSNICKAKKVVYSGVYYPFKDVGGTIKAEKAAT
jgi:hypothetical protein